MLISTDIDRDMTDHDPDDEPPTPVFLYCILYSDANDLAL